VTNTMTIQIFNKET